MPTVNDFAPFPLDVKKIAGFIVMVAAAVYVAKKVPVLKKLV